MRLLMIALLLSGAAALCGCDSKPVDPYSGMQMLTPQEAGVVVEDEDPVLEAERAHNAKFTHKTKRTR